MKIYSRDVQFEFFRLRFQFSVLDPIQFPAGKSGNMLRGAFGNLLRDAGCRCGTRSHSSYCRYARIFEPAAAENAGPSGLKTWPRPFVFRTHDLDGRRFEAGQPFSFDIHLFQVENPPVNAICEALETFATKGVGPGHGRAALLSMEQLGVSIPLAADPQPCFTARVRFLTPTELKCGEQLAPKPEFRVLFARIRDRVSTLRALYGPGPLDLDFRGMGERSAGIEMTRCDLQHVDARRRSSRTGQVHPLGGFIGEAEYRGELAEFLPFLRAARWTGIGRQTVWGKGEIEVV